MKIVSVDIGMRNLAVVTVEYNSDKITNIQFHMHCKQTAQRARMAGRSGPLERCQWIRRIVMSEDFNSADVVIIEQQVQKNVWAMNLMYAMIALIDGPEVIIFSPLCKFTTFGIPFKTAHKAHKKLSIRMARNILNEIIPCARNAFESFVKKDDIADAFNQVITILFCKNKLPYSRDEMKDIYTSVV
jgi:hypothetical protein